MLPQQNRTKTWNKPDRKGAITTAPTSINKREERQQNRNHMEPNRNQQYLESQYNHGQLKPQRRHKHRQYYYRSKPKVDKYEEQETKHQEIDNNLPEDLPVAERNEETKEPQEKNAVQVHKNTARVEQSLEYLLFPIESHREIQTPMPEGAESPEENAVLLQKKTPVAKQYEKELKLEEKNATQLLKKTDVEQSQIEKKNNKEKQYQRIEQPPVAKIHEEGMEVQEKNALLLQKIPEIVEQAQDYILFPIEEKNHMEIKSHDKNVNKSQKKIEPPNYILFPMEKQSQWTLEKNIIQLQTKTVEESVEEPQKCILYQIEKINHIEKLYQWVEQLPVTEQFKESKQSQELPKKTGKVEQSQNVKLLQTETTNPVEKQVEQTPVADNLEENEQDIVQLQEEQETDEKPKEDKLYQTVRADQIVKSPETEQQQKKNAFQKQKIIETVEQQEKFLESERAYQKEKQSQSVEQTPETKQQEAIKQPLTNNLVAEKPPKAEQDKQEKKEEKKKVELAPNIELLQKERINQAQQVEQLRRAENHQDEKYLGKKYPVSILKKSIQSRPDTEKQQQSLLKLKLPKRVTFNLPSKESKSGPIQILKKPKEAQQPQVQAISSVGVPPTILIQKQPIAADRRSNIPTPYNGNNQCQARYECRFCKSNPRLEKYKGTHEMVNVDGTVQCRYLRQVVCPLCKATGDMAHTRKYCPILYFYKLQQ